MSSHQDAFPVVRWWCWNAGSAELHGLGRSNEAHVMRVPSSAEAILKIFSLNCVQLLLALLKSRPHNLTTLMQRKYRGLLQMVRNGVNHGLVCCASVRSLTLSALTSVECLISFILFHTSKALEIPCQTLRVAEVHHRHREKSLRYSKDSTNP